MDINQPVQQSHQIQDTCNYMTTSKRYINNLIGRIVQCAPLLTSLATVGSLFALMHQTEGRFISAEEEDTTVTSRVLDDVQRVYIGPATVSVLDQGWLLGHAG